MNRDQVKLAADSLGRLEALEAALDSLSFVPHRAMPISFFDKGEDDDHQNEHGIKAYYPRERYCEVLAYLIREERIVLCLLGVDL